MTKQHLKARIGKEAFQEGEGYEVVDEQIVTKPYKRVEKEPSPELSGVLEKVKGSKSKLLSKEQLKKRSSSKESNCGDSKKSNENPLKPQSKDFPDLANPQKKEQKITLQYMADEILKKLEIICHEGYLYRYTGKSYQVISDNEELLKLVRSVVSRDAFGSCTVKKFSDLLTFMRVDERAVPKNYEERIKEGKNYVVFNNGVLDLRTLELREHSKKYLTFYELDAKWGTSSNPVYFEKFLKTCSGGDREIERRIVEAMGYMISPINEGKYFFVMGTAPDSGKSTLGALLRYIIGERYVISISTHQLDKRFTLGGIHGKTLDISMDLPKGKLNAVSVAIIKQITGGDVISIEQKYEKLREIHSDMRFLFASNYPVTIPREDDDEAFWRRMITIPFEISLDKEKIDRHMLDRLLKEKDAIIYMCLFAFHEVLNRGYIFSECKAADDMKDKWRNKECDFSQSILPFVEESIEITGNLKDEIYISDLYDKYNEYCTRDRIVPEKGYRLKNWIISNISMCKYKRIHHTGSNPVYGFCGIKWKGDQQ